MGDPDLGLDPDTGEISTAAVERACEQLLGSMALQSYTLVIRCGPKGCYVAKNGGSSRLPSAGRKKRPANHTRGGLTPEIDMMALFSGKFSMSTWLLPHIGRKLLLRFHAVKCADPATQEW